MASSYKIILWLFTVLIVSCGKGSDSSGSAAGSVVRIGSMSITDAKSLFVTGSDAAGLFLNGATGLRASTLYKVTSEGVVEEVTYTDFDGNPTTVTYYPTEVSSPDPRLVFFRFSDGSGYLVKKDDGKAYLLGEPSKRFDSMGYNWITAVQRDFGASDDQISFWGLQMQEDSINAVIWATFDSGNMVKKVMSASGDWVQNYNNDINGNLVYSLGPQEEKATQRSADGVFSKLTSISKFWTTAAGHIVLKRDQADDEKYVVDQTTGTVLKDAKSKVTRIHKQPAGKSTIDQISLYGYAGSSYSDACVAPATNISSCGNYYPKTYTISSNNPSVAIPEVDQLAEFNVRYEQAGFVVSKEDPSSNLIIYSGSYSWSNVGRLDLDLIIDGNNYDGATPFACRMGNIGIQLESSEDIVKLINEDTYEIDAYAFKGRTQPVCAGSLLYAVGDDEKIYAFNVETKTSSVISITGVLDITSFQVSGADTIAVQGHLTDGSSFFGNVDSKGNLTIISKLATGNISIIAPLN